MGQDYKTLPGVDFMKVHAKKMAAKFISNEARSQVGIISDGCREAGDKA